jgi:hypothetical protein
MGLAQAVQVSESWRSRYQLGIQFGMSTANNLMSVCVKKRLLRGDEELSKFLDVDFLKLARLGVEGNMWLSLTHTTPSGKPVPDIIDCGLGDM